MGLLYTITHPVAAQCLEMVIPHMSTHNVTAQCLQTLTTQVVAETAKAVHRAPKPQESVRAGFRPGA